MSINWDDFYFKFEEKFRGPSDEIKKRLSFYKPFLEVFLSYKPKDELKALDIGCGRGEFLEFYKELGFEATGVESNKILVELCKNKGFQVFHEDALTFLKKQEDSAFTVISLIHVAEHLEFKYFVELFFHIHRTLQPAGLFIIEFPNAENFSLGSFNFWLDPTHLRPLHPEFVCFTGEYLGFKRHKTFHTLGISHKSPATLRDVLFGLSLDIGIIFQKDGPSEELARFDNLFQKENLPTTYDLATNFDEGLNSQFHQINHQFHQINHQLGLFASEINQIKNSLQSLEGQLLALIKSKPWRFYQFLGRQKRKLTKDLPHILTFKLKEFLRKRPFLYHLAKKLYFRFFSNRGSGLNISPSGKKPLTQKEEKLYKLLKSYLSQED